MRDLGGHHISRQTTLRIAAVAVASLLVALLAVSADGGDSVPSQEAEIVLVVDLDGETISDSLLGTDRSGRLYVPVCAITEAVSLAISCTDDRAFGFAVTESRPFVIDLREGYVISGRSAYRIGDAAFRSGSDIMVDAVELSKWLPIDFEFNKYTSVLQLRPREALPVQQFKKRQRLKRPPPAPVAKDLPDHTPARRLVAAPAIDFATQLQLTGEEHTTMKGATQNSLDVAGDFLYMSGEGHFSAENETLKRLDLTLSRRRDPAFMVGPVPITQIKVGSSQVPYIDGIGASSKPMYGVYLSNRPIFGSANFLRHDINGSLPQGWDAELFHNGMPIGYQPPTPENMYHFRNLQVFYGVNNFKVVLHGPFGEARESEETFVSDAVTPKGSFLYTVSSVFETGLTDTDSANGQRHRETNTTITSDFGLTRNVTGATALVRHTDLYGVERDYTVVGVRTALRDTLLSGDLISEYYAADANNGGLFTLRAASRDILGFSSVEAVQRVFWNYDSPQFPARPDPWVTLTSLKVNSSFPVRQARVPYSFEVDVESLKSGGFEESSAWRVSGGWNGWNGAVEADLAYQNREFNAGSILQVSTKISEVSIRGQANFSWAPDVYASAINLSADKDLGSGFFFNSSVSHHPTDSVTEFKAGLSKRLGLVGYSFSGTATTKGAFNVSAALRGSLAPDPFNHQALISSEPLSPYGMVAVSAVVAGPDNPAGKPLSGIGFLVNGSRAATMAGMGGVPVVVNLQPDIPVDITVDLTTVEDPFMIPLEDGCRIVPRAGVVAACRFTMTTGGEIDGMILVHLQKVGEVPLKDVRVDLVTEGGKLLATTRSQESGYYLFKTVKPGNYRVVIPESELARLKTAAIPPLAVTMPVGGDMVSGKDFNLLPDPEGRKDAGAKGG
jgi:hypothetical protein